MLSTSAIHLTCSVLHATDGQTDSWNAWTHSNGRGNRVVTTFSTSLRSFADSVKHLVIGCLIVRKSIAIYTQLPIDE